MNQFLVPQFIDVEPKIIGPFNLRQFIFIIIGILSLVLCYKFADLALFIIEAVIISVIVILVGFIKINGREFHFFFLDLFVFGFGSNTRIWKKEDFIKYVLTVQKEKTEEELVQKENMKRNKLSELSLLLDTGGAFRADESEGNNESESEVEDKNKEQSS